MYNSQRATSEIGVGHGLRTTAVLPEVEEMTNTRSNINPPRFAPEAARAYAHPRESFKLYPRASDGRWRQRRAPAYETLWLRRGSHCVWVPPRIERLPAQEPRTPGRIATR